MLHPDFRLTAYHNLTMQRASVLQNYSSTYAKLAMFGFAAWGASTGGGVVIGITMGALVWCIAFSAIEMLQVRQPCLHSCLPIRAGQP